MDKKTYLPGTKEHDAILTKLKEPFIWSVFSKDIHIIELQENRYQDALDVMREHYLPTNVLCRSLQLVNDEESVLGLLAGLLFEFKDSCSVIAIDVATNEIIGVLINSATYKDDYTLTFKRLQISKGVLYEKMVGIRHELFKKSHVFEKLGVKSLLYMSALCIVPKFRHIGLGKALLKTGLYIAKRMGLEGVLSTFSSGNLQNTALKLGLKIIYKIDYVHWIVNGEMVIDDPRAGNYFMALMAKKFDDVIEDDASK